ncbi:hypothetical protein T8K17_25680 (plasmid) [Thalassobaculum sp. OXR-137]|uniref:hypothetical protein n=1 Tax=Thalassobaculum sp. OXR-137 TaxID=3100173 RepID=UPI002AC9E112|nr:hypothetical protein [Thalassobaculum sp. OXR-137]WPZ37271.1 hypothetical protein T8K17_25680 [Thalassobaculum sp. OXR-137]
MHNSAALAPPPARSRPNADDQIRIWVDHPDLGSDELAVLIGLSRFAHFHTGVAWPSSERLRQSLGKNGQAWSKKRLQAAIDYLVAHGHLQVTTRRSATGRNGGRIFRIVAERYDDEELPEFRTGTLDATQGSATALPRVPDRNPELDSRKQTLSQQVQNCEEEKTGSVVTLITTDWKPSDESVDLVTACRPDLDQTAFLARFRLKNVGKGLVDPDRTYRAWAAAERHCKSISRAKSTKDLCQAAALVPSRRSLTMHSDPLVREIAGRPATDWLAEAKRIVAEMQLDIRAFDLANDPVRLAGELRKAGLR